jgi:hypothetical protein
MPYDPKNPDEARLKNLIDDLEYYQEFTEDFGKKVHASLKDINIVMTQHVGNTKRFAEAMRVASKDVTNMATTMGTFRERMISAASAATELRVFGDISRDSIEAVQNFDELNKEIQRMNDLQKVTAKDTALRRDLTSELTKDIRKQSENEISAKRAIASIDAKILEDRSKWTQTGMSLDELRKELVVNGEMAQQAEYRLRLATEFGDLNEELLKQKAKEAEIEKHISGLKMASAKEKWQQKLQAQKLITEGIEKSMEVKKKEFELDNKHGKLTTSTLTTRIHNLKSQIATSQTDAAKVQLLLAEKELQNTKNLAIENRRLGGYMAYMGDEQYKMLGPVGSLINSTKKWKDATSLIPNEFVTLDILIKKGIERFIELDKAAEDFRKLTGFSSTQMKELRKDAEAINVQFADMGVRIENVYKSAKALTDVFGRTSLVSKEALKNVSLLSVNLGVAEESSANVLSTFQGLGGATEQAAMNIIKVGAGISEKAGVPFRLVMQDVANASETTLSMLGANPSRLMKSAIAARAMGMELNKMVASQRKLLDFSASINDELEASALLGKNINFQLARQLAFEGRTEDAARATLDVVKRSGDFNKMNIYQREALAKASGMELKDLTKMMAVDAQRDAILNGSDDAKRKILLAQEKELKQLKERDKLDSEDLVKQNQKALMQQRMQGIMTKLKNIFDSISVAIGDILEPIITPLAAVIIPAFRLIGILAKVLGFILKGLLLPITLIGKGFGYVADAIDSAISSFTGFSDDVKEYITYALGVVGGVGTLYYLFFGGGGVSGLLKNIGGVFAKAKEGMGSLLKSGAGAIKDKVSSIFGKGSGDATKAATESASASEKIKPAAGEGVKNFLKDLAEGLKAMKGGDVLFGALNLIPASIGLIAMIPGFVGASLLSRLDGGAIKTALTGLAEGLTSMASTTVLGGSIALAVAAAGLAVMLVGIPAMAAIAVLGTAFSAGLIAMSTGLSALGGNPMAWLGIAAIGVLSLAFVGFGYAAKLMAEAFTQIADSLPEVISPLADIVMMSPLFGLAAAGIGILGVSIAGLALLAYPAIIAAGAITLLGLSTSILSKGIEPLERLARLDVINAAMGIGSLGVALTKFGAGSAAAGLGSFVGKFLGGDPIKRLEQFSNMGDKLKETAESINTIASATAKFGMVDAFADAVNRLVYSLERLNKQLDTSKEIKVESLNALTAAGSKVESTTAATSTSSSSSVIESKLDELIALLRDGAIGVTLDGEKVSRAMAGRGRE